VTKKGEKYELDRQNWTTYSNFKLMYDNIAIEMVDSGIAIELDTPLWKDAYGHNCEKQFAYRFKVTYDIVDPDYFLMADEVGGNLNQKGDGHVGGTRLICERGTVLKKVTSNTEKHFTILGFTTVNGEPVMCCVIIAGIV